MTDPFSIVVGAAGLVSLGLQVIGALFDFYEKTKHQSRHTALVVERLEILQGILKRLDFVLENRKNDQNLDATIQSSFKRCLASFEKLRDETEKFKPNGNKYSFRANYHFKDSTLNKLAQSLLDICVVLQEINLETQISIRKDVVELRSIIQHLQINQLSSMIREWLRAPDATFDQNNIWAKHCEGTGMWLFQEQLYTRWLSQENSLLWISGFAGTGKSVLCSSAITRISDQGKKENGIGLAFFYFRFDDVSKQSDCALVKALLFQLSSQCPAGHKILKQLYESFHPSEPPVLACLEFLRQLAEQFYQVYILLDAVDEIPRHMGRDKVLKVLKQIQSWKLQRIHVLITSRDEPDIHQCLQTTSAERITLSIDENRSDIKSYINTQLKSQEFKLWEKYHDTIRDKLADRAQGIFRWVECQLRDLKSLPRSEAFLDQWLNNLPFDLTECYDRMLCKIPMVQVANARRLLSILCFSERPLIAAEVQDAIAVDLEKQHLDRHARVEDVESLYEICPGLIQFTIWDDEHPKTSIINLAHASVREYLRSRQANQQQTIPESLVLHSSTAHSEISQICLIHLMDHELRTDELTKDSLKGLPFAQYAAMYWYAHYKVVSQPIPEKLNDLILRLFKDKSQSFLNWVRLSDIQNDSISNLNIALNDVPPPFHYACFLGLPEILRRLIQDVYRRGNADMSFLNTSYGKYGPPILAASRKNHVSILKILISEKVDVNAPCGWETFEHGTALSVAANLGHYETVEVLLDNGANPNFQLGSTPTALQTSSARGHKEIVQLLLQNGAEVNAITPGWLGTALHAACYAGNLKMVELLINYAADSTVKNREFRTVLQAACFGGNPEIVNFLLKDTMRLSKEQMENDISRPVSVNRSDAIIQSQSDAGIWTSFDASLHATSILGRQIMVEGCPNNQAYNEEELMDLESAIETAMFRKHMKVVKLLCIAGKNSKSDMVRNALMRTLIRRTSIINDWEVSKFILILLVEHFADQPLATRTIITMAMYIDEEMTKQLSCFLIRRCQFATNTVKNIISHSEHGDMITNWLLDEFEDQSCTVSDLGQNEKLVEALKSRRERYMTMTDEAAAVVKAATDDLRKELVNHAGRPLKPSQIIKIVAKCLEDDLNIFKMIMSFEPSWVDTSEIAPVAAINPKFGIEMLEMLLKSPSNQIDITETARVAARNPKCGKDILNMLLKFPTNQINIAQIALIAAENTGCGNEILEMLLESSTSHIDIPQIALIAAKNSGCGKEIMRMILKLPSRQLDIAEIALNAARNPGCGKEILDMVLESPVNQVDFPKIALIAASNQGCGKEILAMILKSPPKRLDIAQVTLQAAANNLGEEVVDKLVDFALNQIVDSLTENIFTSKKERAIAKELENKETEKIHMTEIAEILARYLKSLPDTCENFWERFLQRYSLQVTKEILVSAVQNCHIGEVILEGLLEHQGPNTEIEQSVFQAAWNNRHTGKRVMEFVLNKPLKPFPLPDDFIEQVLQLFGAKAIEFILPIVQDIGSVTNTIIAIAKNHKEGNILIETLLGHAKEAILSALDDMSGREAMFYLAQLGSVEIMKIVISREGTEGTESIMKWINTSDSAKRTPYYFAIVKGRSRMARFLREEYGAHL